MKLLLLILFPLYSFGAANSLNPAGNPSVVNPANALMGSAQIQFSYSTNSITVSGAGYAPCNQTYTFESNGVCSPDNGISFFWGRVYQSADQKFAIYDVDPSRNPGGWIGTNDGVKLNAGTSSMYLYYWFSKDGTQPIKWSCSGGSVLSPWNTPLGIAPTPTFTYQGAGFSSAGVGFDIRQATECPNIGDAQVFDTNPELFEQNNNGYYIFYQGTGKQGVVRSIKYTSGVGIAEASQLGIPKLKTSTNAVRLSIWTDLGTLGSFAVPASTPTMDLPFVTLMGNRYRTNVNWGYLSYQSEFVDVNSKYTANASVTAFDNQYTIRFHMPIYYTNGIYIQITSNGFAMGGGYAETTYENGVLPLPWSTIRARSQFLSITNTATQTNIVFLNYSTPPVLITGLMISAQSTDTTWPESLFRYGWGWAADAEDTFLNSWFFNWSTYTSRYSGTTTCNTNPAASASAPYQAEAYRFWNKYDAPVWFGNPTPLLGMWAQHAGNLQLDILSLFYAP